MGPGKTNLKKPSPRARGNGRLLSAGEPAPFRVENERGGGTGLVICDHASNRVPRSLKDLGLSKADLGKHIAWDIGAEDISRRVGKALDMPVIVAGYSRLVADLNRAPGHPECMAAASDQISVPENARLSREERERRLKEIYRPYQERLGRLVDGFVNKNRTPVLISIHSFTPVMGGMKRPWHLSVLWRREEKMAKQLVRELRKNHPDLLVGENEPYSLFDERFKGSTMDCHAEKRHLPYIFVEFRQDLVNTREKATRWANILVQALGPVLENPETYAGRGVGSRRKKGK